MVKISVSSFKWWPDVEVLLTMVSLLWTILNLLEVKVVNLHPRRSIQTTNDQLLRQCLFQPSHQTVRFYLKLTKDQEISERNRGA